MARGYLHNYGTTPGGTPVTLAQEMHKVTSGEDAAGYFTLSQTPTSSDVVRVTPVGGVMQVNKQTVGATGATPDFDVLNDTELHINNTGAATGLSELIGTDDILIIEYQY